LKRTREKDVTKMSR